MGKADLALVLECVDALGTLAEFNCMMGHGRKAAHIIAEQLENYFKVGLWYRKRTIVNLVTRAFEGALRECYIQDRVDFRPGLMTLRRSVRNMRRVLDKEQPAWRHQSRQLEKLLQL